MAYLITFISLCIISNAFASSQSRPYHIGFMGTRGKRSINEENNSGSTTTTLTHYSLEIPQTNLKPNQNDYNGYMSYYSGFPELSVFKRAPVGFMGMRGKKDFEYFELNDKAKDNALISSKGRKIPLSTFNRIIMNSSPKRTPYGFVGMRGKKQDDFLDSKRVAPAGFFGTRGKKDLNDFEEYNDEEFENFVLGQNYDLIDSNMINDDLIKRTPYQLNSGFFGMRGKKFSNDYDEVVKRAPTGFLGMRGKKSYEDLMSFDAEKRKMNGFFGMRGKKDVSSQLNENKRSLQLAQFFGIRGKKQPFNSGFFGMRGKKQPFQFRGKFVGVRGKKSLEDFSTLHRSDDFTNLNNNDESLSVSSTSNLPNDETIKRGPSGFVGMRGKKEYDTNDVENKN